MALTATMYRVRLDLSDVDRGVYDALDLRMAQHPSETVAFFLTRLLAFALEQREHLAFGKGISDADEPAIWARDYTDKVLLWLDVGAPSPERIHKASKLADEVVIYTHRDLDRVVDDLSGKGVHQAENIRVVGVPTELLDALEARLDRNTTWGLLRTEGVVYVSGEGWSVEGALVERRLS